MSCDELRAIPPKSLIFMRKYDVIDSTERKHAFDIVPHSTYANPIIIWVHDDTFIAPLQIQEVYECMMTLLRYVLLKKININ